ncbi:primosomal protein N' (replication factor Y) [Bacillus pakistanensis]|uniref:Replication restart protein PriA n=1 Tax=Rossellomorea pakistanensis TaxID=992288 RepID=A0ABS2NGS0_9BACI|nr:primosomal protein N' [Bacillus pakistanensis]MBM7586781.1 primosomal protein N' (replication factor Y) [Bacillus pakistanensis]
MSIASVIVDVPTMQTDREYDYKIPAEWEGIIAVGMRVVVPFGPRKIQGFVVGTKEHSNVKRLKSIVEPMDLVPVLNQELLEMAEWLTEKTLCFKISALQVMLPAAMKAKYEKKIVLSNDKDSAFLSENINKIFQSKTEISWKEADKQRILPELQKEVTGGRLEIVYEVKAKAKSKTRRKITLAQPEDKIESLLGDLPANAKKQKEILHYLLKNARKQGVPTNEILNATGSSDSTIKTLVEKKLIIETREEVYRDPFQERDFPRTKPFSLTKEQEKSILPILDSIENKIHKTFLLYGVTGSGKTEVYLQSIQKVLEDGKEAIVLVPEIALTPQMVQRFKGRFGDEVAVLHSGLSVGEKYDEWRKIQRKEVKVVVGARSAIFAPFENLGIIIIDEEHETSYKQEENPRYHARDVAVYRGNRYHCPVVLGSATPSLESFARAKKDVYQLLTLQKRMNEGELPQVSVVDMREELRSGNRSMFSTELFNKLKDRLEKKQQTVLFLNRRGHSSFIMCRDCGFVQQCPQCDISLTYHRASNQMKCHYCGYETIVPTKCPECNSEHIRYFGTGTQKVEEELTKLLPEARVIRMDVDTTSRKGSHERLLNQFGEGKADILLGTQMIAKGLDFPNITLVGVLSADTMLHLPDFRSAEKTFQLLTQVSGRAGRHDLPGEVVIQTYTPEHYSIEHASLQDYDSFYKKEMMMRKIGSYPPFYYIALLTITHEDLLKVVSVSEKISNFLRSRLSKSSIILGPVASPIPRINNRYRYQCLIKYKREPMLTDTLQKILTHSQQQYASEGLTVSIDVNPYMMM